VQRGHTPSFTVAIATPQVCCSCEEKGGSRHFEQQKQVRLARVGIYKLTVWKQQTRAIRADISVGYIYWLQRIMGCGSSKGASTPPPQGQQVPRGTAGEAGVKLLL
jgi:hypothetical protein